MVAFSSGALVSGRRYAVVGSVKNSAGLLSNIQSLPIVVDRSGPTIGAAPTLDSDVQKAANGPGSRGVSWPAAASVHLQLPFSHQNQDAFPAAVSDTSLTVLLDGWVDEESGLKSLHAMVAVIPNETALVLARTLAPTSANIMPT